jgi:hypothetical protein
MRKLEEKKLLGRHWPGDGKIVLIRDFAKWVGRA